MRFFMKAVTVSLFIFFLCIISLSPAAFAGDSNPATILFTGSVSGAVNPIRH